MVVFDTGIISRLLGRKQNKAIFDKTEKIGFENICISIITRVELFNWLSCYKELTKSERAKALKIIKAFPVIQINENISKIAQGFSDKDINAKPNDLLIGATAYYHGFSLYTLNKKDFNKFGIDLF